LQYEVYPRLHGIFWKGKSILLRFEKINATLYMKTEEPVLYYLKIMFSSGSYEEVTSAPIGTLEHQIFTSDNRSVITQYQQGDQNNHKNTCTKSEIDGVYISEISSRKENRETL
jgi:hypothetical protein